MASRWECEKGSYVGYIACRHVYLQTNFRPYSAENMNLISYFILRVLTIWQFARQDYYQSNPVTPYIHLLDSR